MKFKVTFKYGRTVKNPANVCNNGYDFIEDHYTVNVTVTDREEERDYFKRRVAVEKAAKAARKKYDIPFTIPSCLVSVEKI